MLTQQIVKELLDYDPETGKLFWKERDAKWFNSKERSAEHLANNWNNQNAGKEAFIVNQTRSYKAGKLFNKTYKAHRIIWLWMTGEWPNQVDHINREASDNRWCNLRNVSQLENSKNKSVFKNNKTGYPGVTKLKCSYSVRIFANKKLHYLGTRKTLEEAISLRKEAEAIFGFHENHAQRPHG